MNSDAGPTGPDGRKRPIPVRFPHEGVQREAYVWLPAGYDPSVRYYVLISAPGGGSTGTTFWLTHDLMTAAEHRRLKVIIVSPSFLKHDPNLQRFPILGEGPFLERLIDELHMHFKTYDKILLTGYSRGAQFAHRFAFERPDLVQACAPLSSGTWTTPDGRFFMYGVAGDQARREAIRGIPRAVCTVRSHDGTVFLTIHIRATQQRDREPAAHTGETEWKRQYSYALKSRWIARGRRGRSLRECRSRTATSASARRYG